MGNKLADRMEWLLEATTTGRNQRACGMGPLAYGYGTSGSHSVVGYRGCPNYPDQSERSEGKRNRQTGGQTDGPVSLLQVAAAEEGSFWSRRGAGGGGQRGRCTAETHRTSRDGRTS